MSKIQINNDFISEYFSPTGNRQIKGISISEKRENTRSYIAMLFVIGYISVILALIIVSYFTINLGSFIVSKEIDNPEKVKDFLLAISSPLGFVIGFYFNKTDSK